MVTEELAGRRDFSSASVRLRGVDLSVD
jgi:hypothetical protein